MQKHLMGSPLCCVCLIFVLSFWETAENNCLDEGFSVFQFSFFQQNIEGNVSVYKSISETSKVAAFRSCVDDSMCLSVTYDAATNTASLYDYWNEGQGGQYELNVFGRCPRNQRFRYSRKFGLCFVVFEVPLSWSAASDFCTNVLNSSLVILDTQEKLDYILQADNNGRFLTGTGTLYWVGAYYNQHQQTFEWMDFTAIPLNSSAWDTKRPIVPPVRDGVGVGVISRGHGLYEDRLSNRMTGFICEYWGTLATNSRSTIG